MFLSICLADDLACVEKNIAKSRNIWYEARLMECNHEKLSKPKKVFIYITPKVSTSTVNSSPHLTKSAV